MEEKEKRKWKKKTQEKKRRKGGEKTEKKETKGRERENEERGNRFSFGTHHWTHQ